MKSSRPSARIRSATWLEKLSRLTSGMGRLVGVETGEVDEVDVEFVAQKFAEPAEDEAVGVKGMDENEVFFPAGTVGAPGPVQFGHGGTISRPEGNVNNRESPARAADHPRTGLKKDSV